MPFYLLCINIYYIQTFLEYIGEIYSPDELVKKAEELNWDEYLCPHCGGRAFRGDPSSGNKFRGSAVCVDCKKGFAAIRVTPKIDRGQRIK
jgi:DNA-directed RNA polymerase subunit RPC12/RpoP